ncbi:hypothetical protein PFDG_02588, partial [Plasmodium falciparum Dd2]
HLRWFWKIHEEINFKQKKENHLIFTKENIFLLYEDLLYCKTNYINEQDVITNWCEASKNIILNRILRKENKKQIMILLKDIEEKYFTNIEKNNSSVYINYFSKEDL